MNRESTCTIGGVTPEWGVNDELVMELSCIAGALEAMEQIHIPSWDELSDAISDAIYEYYENNTTGAKCSASVAKHIYRECFAISKPID